MTIQCRRQHLGGVPPIARVNNVPGNDSHGSYLR
jgi:hypothetical protein